MIDYVEPVANIGIATGYRSDLLVIDMDPRNGGVEQLEALESWLGKELHSNLIVDSGGGGRHFYFKF